MITKKTKKRKLSTNRVQRGLYLAATGAVNQVGRARYQVNTHTVALNLGYCTCRDARRNECKHLIAAETVHQHGQISVSLAMLMAAGGGVLEQSHKGGIGKYFRLERNAIVNAPMAVEWGIDNQGVERLYPAAIIEDQHGFELVALTSNQMVKKIAPALYEKCKVSLMVELNEELAKHEDRSAKAKRRQQLRKAA